MSSKLYCRLLLLCCLFSNYAFAVGKLERVSLLRGGGEQGASTTEEDEVAKLKQEHMLLPNSNLPRQRVTESGQFKANGRTYSVKDLQPFNVFTYDGTIMVDGEPQPLEDDSNRSRLFMRKGEHGETILVSREGEKEDTDGRIKSIDVLGHDGTEVFLQALSDGSLVSIRQEDVDRQKLKGLSIGGIRGDEDELILDPNIDDDSGNNRKLQQGCSSYKVVEVAIAYDSSFCSQVARGSPDTARSVVEAAVARAALLFEEICIRVRLSHLEGYCTASQDPYRTAMATNDIGCGSRRGALQVFQNIWQNSRTNINRDAAHLFYGTNFPGSAIGCASTPALCNSQSYGVNQMSISSNPIFQGNLFAHELGHNMGSPHVSDPTNSGNFLMEPSLNSASNGLSSQSTRSIQNYISRRSCVSTEDGDSNGGGGDTGGDNNGDDNNGGGSNGESFRLESSLHQGFCVAVQGNVNLTNGTPVNLERCNDSSSAQNWIWDPQTRLIQSTAPGNKCLYPLGNARNGARMVVWDCNPSFSYAEWSYYSDRSLRPDFATRKCLDVLNANGETLQMWQCNGTQDKQWLVRR
ncbi:unnamed protein product [Cylindrotheca closterium]|uniref:Peptidase M12B domain-containing protein n=1 Tax=Cylindrotheca closterium TaxID=2856 RepID=A0AAD2CBK6_9STRA|nr:unnamed protein product [Cylindrotheca closterium]